MEYPVVSIGIGSYNNAAYLGILLDSIRAQTYPVIEVIVVDDCSTDNSVEVVQRWMERTNYPVTFVQRAANQGLVRTYSECTRLSTGRFVSLVGSDDVLDPDLIARTVEEFDRRGPTCGAVYSDCRLIDSAGQEIAPSFLRYFNSGYMNALPEGNLIVPLLQGFYLPTLTTTVRREALDAVGTHDTTLFSEDLDMWLRISRKFSFGYLPAVLGSYRVHDASAVHTNKLALNETYFKIYKKGYFQGDEEWQAARNRLADNAEHYYASRGSNASEFLLYAFKETKAVKLLLFAVAYKTGLSYERLMSIVGRK